MKTLFKAHIVTFLLGLLVFTVGCSKDDNVESPSQQAKSQVVGTWTTNDSRTVFVFRNDGTGQYCEHANSSNATLKDFTFAYDQSSKHLSLTFSDGTINLQDAKVSSVGSSLTFKNVSEKFLDNAKTVSLSRESTPFPLLTISESDLTVMTASSSLAFSCGASGGLMETVLQKNLLWHENNAGIFDVTASVTSDVDGMIASHDVQNDEAKAYIALNISQNPVARSKTATLELKANGKSIPFMVEQLNAQSSGKSMDIVPVTSTVSAQGGTLSFIIYNKDQRDLMLTRPSTHAVTWESLSTTRYAGGQDWLCKATVPSKTSSTDTEYTYKFWKDDGTVLYFTVKQLAGTGGSSGGTTGGDSGGTGGTTEPVWGKVKATAKVSGPGLAYDSEAQYYDGKTGTIDYVYYPSSGKYYIYSSYFGSDPDANGGKGVRHEAQKGNNSVCVYHGVYFDYSKKYTIKYNWDLYLRFTLP